MADSPSFNNMDVSTTETTSSTSNNNKNNVQLNPSSSNQLVKSNASICNSSFMSLNSSKSMIENVENFCDPNWANSGFQHMEGKNLFFLIDFDRFYLALQ